MYSDDKNTQRVHNKCCTGQKSHLWCHFIILILTRTGLHIHVYVFNIYCVPIFSFLFFLGLDLNWSRDRNMVSCVTGKLSLITIIIIIIIIMIIIIIIIKVWLATQSVNILHYSPPVPSSERRQPRVSCEQNAFPVCCRNKLSNFTTNQASYSWNTWRRWRSLVWKF